MVALRRDSGLWRSPLTTDGDLHLEYCQIDLTSSTVSCRVVSRHVPGNAEKIVLLGNMHLLPWPPRHFMWVYRQQDGEKNIPSSSHLRGSNQQAASAVPHASSFLARDAEVPVTLKTVGNRVQISTRQALIAIKLSPIANCTTWST